MKQETTTSTTIMAADLVKKMFRYIEVCLGLILLLWIFAHLSFAVQISGEYLRQVARIISSPLFIFLLCNAIIAALFAKSARFSAGNPADTEVYDQRFMKNSESPAAEKALPVDGSDVANFSLVSESEEVVYQDKEIITGDDKSDLTQSERLTGESGEIVVEKFRRSETEKFELVAGEDLSNEEFQKAVDDFIAKHLKFRRDESSMAVVVANQMNIKGGRVFAGCS